MKTFFTPFAVALCAVFCLTAAAADSPVSYHQAIQPLDLPCYGPFVHTYDGAIVGLAGKSAMRSTDGGQTWESFPALPDEGFSIVGDAYSLVRVGRDLVAAFCNIPEMKQGKWAEGSVTDWEIPVYSIRSTDGGRTWSEPLPIQRDWVGALRAMVTTKGGRVVLAAMGLTPWHHIIKVYISDDRGEHWIHTAVVDMPDCKINDHVGAMEPKIIERKDGSLYMLIRTTKGTFYSSVSVNGGVTWSQPVSTGIENNNSFGELAVMSDGSWILIWNRDPALPAFDYHPDPNADPNPWAVVDKSYSWIKPRNKLSCAISPDEGKTWSDPVILASTENLDMWLAYTVFFEPQPGLFWVSTSQGALHMKVRRDDLFPASGEGNGP